MNETECEDLIKSVKWTEPANLISLAILEFINVLVIGGNCLVIAAVFCSNKLRSVTNFFIVNLAVADLLVGLAVLPFSATWEVFKVSAKKKILLTKSSLRTFYLSLSVTGLDIWRCLVPHLAGRGCLDVHGIDTESVCHIIGSLCCRHATRHLSEHYVNEEGKVFNRWHLGTLLRYLLSTSGRLEGSKGKQQIDTHTHTHTHTHT